jgi:hypothetical protein
LIFFYLVPGLLHPSSASPLSDSLRSLQRAKGDAARPT